MAAYTVSCLGTNGEDVPDRVLECVRQNGFSLSVAAVASMATLRVVVSLTFSIPGAVGGVNNPIDAMTSQIRGLAGVVSVAAV